MRKQMVWMLSGMLAGSVISSAAVVAAEPLQVALSQVRLMINGNDKTPAGGSYWNGMAQVPLAFEYEGTTYMPIRYISESLGMPVQWDGNTRTIWVGDRPAAGIPHITLGGAVQPVDGLPVTYTPISSKLYDAGDSNVVRVSVAVRNDGVDAFSFGSYQSLFVGRDGTKFTASLNAAAGGSNQVDPKTTRVVDYYATLPKSAALADFELHLTKIDFASYPAQYKDWAVVSLQDEKTEVQTYTSYQTGTFSIKPYQLELGSVFAWSYKASTTTQIYKVHAKTTKDGQYLTLPNSTELIFEVVDGNGQSVAQTRYAVGSSSNAAVTVLGDGDQYITFPTLDWYRYNNTGAKLNVYEAFGQGKRLLGTFTVS